MTSRHAWCGGLILALLALSAVSGFASWQKIAQFNGMGRVTACYFFDARTGIIGFDGVRVGSPLLRTADGGATWQSVSTPKVSVIWTCDIWFRNSMEGWASFLADSGGLSGFLWHSTDGGLSWSPTSLYGALSHVRATSKAVVVTQFSPAPGIHISTDGGATFSTSYGASQNGIDFVDDLHGASATYVSGQFAYSADGGISWNQANGRPDEVWGVLGLQGTSTFLAASEGAAEIDRSSDYGHTWNPAFHLAVNGAIAGSEGSIYVQTLLNGVYRSTDTGMSWTNIGGPSNFYDCAIAAFPCVIYAFDDNGGAWKSIDAGGSNLLTLSSNSLFTGDTIQCDSVTQSLIIGDTGCTPPSIESLSLVGPDSANYHLIATADTISVSFLPGTAGYSHALLLLTLSDGTQDTITLNGYSRIPRTLALDTTPIDLGTLSPCESRDTAIAYTNTSCVPIIFIGWRMEHYGDGFNVYNINYQPITIPAGATDSLHITFDGTHSGVVYDTVLVMVGTDGDSVRRIPVQTFVPAVDSVDFLLRMPAQLAAGQQFSAGVFPDRMVSSSKGLISLSGRLRFRENDFIFDSITSDAGLQLRSSVPSVTGGLDQVNFSVSNASGISLDPAIPIARLWLESALTDTIDYSIQLDSVLLNGGDPQYGDCALATNGSGVSAAFAPSCGDSTIIRAMVGHALLFTTLPKPNPVGDESGYAAHFTMQSVVDGIAVIDLCDALGRTISSESLALGAGETKLCSLNLSNSPSGSYFYTVRLISSYGLVARSGSILVIR